MRKKEKIYLASNSYRSGGGYKVTKLIDSLRFKIGEVLLETDVKKLLRLDYVTVTINGS